jgi:hypothetical protein
MRSESSGDKVAKYLALILSILSFIFPMAMAAAILLNQTNLDSPEFQKKFGVLTENLRTQS